MALKIATRVVGKTVGESLAHVKAALLYADEVFVQWADRVASYEEAALMSTLSPPLLDPEAQRIRERLIFEDLQARQSHMRSELQVAREAGVLTGGEARETEMGRILQALTEAGEVKAETDEDLETKLMVLMGVEALAVPPDHIPLVGAVAHPDRISLLGAHPPRWLALPPSHDAATTRMDLWQPLPAVREAFTSERGVADTAEVALAARLLGELPAFPHADMADILDVRERLADARTRFRKTMAAAGRDLKDVPEADFNRAVETYRREHVDDALLTIREELEDLGAVTTLSRSLQDARAVPVVVGLCVAAAVIDLGAAAALGMSSTSIALAAREAGARRAIRRQIRRQPFWYLREVERGLASR